MRLSFLKIKDTILKELRDIYRLKVEEKHFQSSDEEEAYTNILEELSSNWEVYESTYKIEALMQGFHLCFNKSSFRIEDIWSVLYKQPDLIPCDDIKKFIIDILCLHFKSKYTVYQIEETLEQYMLLSYERRNFSLITDASTNTSIIEVTNNASYRHLFFNLFFDRKYHQHQRQQLPPVLQRDDLPFRVKIRDTEVEVDFIPDKLLESIYGRSSFIKQFLAKQEPNGAVTSDVLDECLGLMQFSRICERQKVDWTNLDVDLSSDPYLEAATFINEEREKRGEHGRDYVESRNNFKIRANQTDQPHLLRYKKLLHIIGKTGSGKNTFIDLEVTRVKNKGAKSGVILTKVQDVFQHVTKMNSHGLTAAPMIGKSNILNHLGTELTSLHSQYSNDPLQHPLSLLPKQKNYRYFSNDCLIKTIANISDENYFPCTELTITIDGNQAKRCCPFFAICGAGTRDRELLSADVWIGTIDSFFQSRPLPIFNDMNKSYAEIAHSLLDVLYVDEGDSTQERMDMLPVTQNEIFGQVTSSFEKDIIKIKNELEVRHLLANDTDVNLFIEHTRHATIMVKNIIGLLIDSLSLRKYLKNRTFTIFEIANEVAEQLAVHTDDVERVHESLVSINEEDAELRTIMDVFFGKFNQLKLQKYSSIDIRPRYMHELAIETMNIISDLLNIPFRKELTLKETTLFMFSLFLIKFDYLYRVLTNLVSSLPISIEHGIDKRFDIIKRYIPFMPEPLTERSFQYQYKVRDNEATGTFSLYEYIGVGRNLLLHFSDLYLHLGGIHGPAVILLSGTSVAPFSPHFHVEKSVDYIISSTVTKEEKSQFKIEYAICHNENNLPISVSGMSEEGKKTAIKQMARGDLPSIILKELNEWDSRMGTDAGRGVFLITNSYEQSDIVHMELNRYLPNHLIYSLAPNNAVLKDNQIPLNLIQQFHKYQSRILIAPMKPISTGLNILKENSDKSFFGTFIFLVRPLPPPGQLDDMIKVLNGSSQSYIQNLIDKKILFGEGTVSLKRDSLKLMRKLISVDKAFSRLEDEYRYPISWYVMKDVRQTIGRGQRGETDVRILLADASWLPTTDKASMTKSLLHDWLFMLEHSKSTETEELYHDLYLALRQLLEPLIIS
jgi:hypothetical protein